VEINNYVVVCFVTGCPPNVERKPHINVLPVTTYDNEIKLDVQQLNSTR